MIILWGEPMTTEEYRARTDLLSKIYLTIAALLVYLASISIAYDVGRTDHAWVTAQDAEERADEASLCRDVLSTAERTAYLTLAVQETLRAMQEEREDAAEVWEVDDHD